MYTIVKFYDALASAWDKEPELLISLGLTDEVYKKIEQTAIKHLSGWRREHPQADISDEIEKALFSLGFEDTSWHNDTQASFNLTLPSRKRICLWVDYKNPDLREVDGWSRFSIQIENDFESEEYIDDMQTDHFSVALARVTYLKKTL